MNNKFLIIDKLKKTIIYIDKTLDNYPHRYIEIKDNINNSLYDLLEYCYYANNDIDKFYYQR